MSTSQASQATEAIDTAITTAQFLKNWVAGRYRNLINWGTTNAGNRVTCELQLHDKKGKATGKWEPISLLITDLTTNTIEYLTANTIVQPVVEIVGKTNVKVFGAPPTGKTNWRRIMIQNGTPGPSTQSNLLYLLPDPSAGTGSAMFILGPLYLPFSNAPNLAVGIPFIADNFASSIWVVSDAVSTSTATLYGVGYA